MDINWAHAAPSVLAAFFASIVEFIEALTIVLAVGAVRGWRGAIGGTALALVALLLVVVTLGPAMTTIPQNAVQQDDPLDAPQRGDEALERILVGEARHAR